MRKALVLAVFACLLVAVAVQAAPDPWRIKVTDLNPLEPTVITTAYYERIWFVLPNLGEWGTTGGKGRIYYRDYAISGGSGLVAPFSYTASTGDISFGTITYTSIEGVGTFGVNQIIQLSANSYKKWTRGVTGLNWTGHSVGYMTSTDGINFSVPSVVTVYGSTVQNTDSYGRAGGYRSTGGVYMLLHGNSMASSQNAHGHGLATSGVGETVWYDIDTLPPGPGFGGLGDPFTEPRSDWNLQKNDSNHQGRMARACDGNLFVTLNAFNNRAGAGPTPDYTGQGLGLAIGTAGELAGGDHYVWLADPDNDNTQGIGNTLLSSMGGPGGPALSGLSGPSLRTYMDDSSWRGWYGFPVGLKANQTDPATQFVLFYFAMWDTDSNGTRDIAGLGRAKLLLTRNKGDLNYDGTVSFSDVSLFSGSFGASSGQPGYNPDADLNTDGKVDFLDTALLSGRYGSDCSYGQ